MSHATFRKIALLFFAAVCLLPVGAADEAAKPVAKSPPSLPKDSSTFVFSILPKAFQSHPLLSISVITEMTDEGRKLKVPTSTSPSYYYVVSSGYHREGHGVSQVQTVSEEHLEKEVKKALAESSYLEGSKEHPATLVLFFVWGVHTKLAEDDPNTGDGGVEDLGYRNLLSRAALVGGNGFAKELAAALEEQSSSAGGDRLLNPVYRFVIRSDKNRTLMEQVLDDCYYVVISAYEGSALARGEKKLLWRTKMSTSAQGVSLAETSTALIASGGPFFGREMTEPSLVGKRIGRTGKVELGELKFKGYEEPEAKSAKESSREKK